MRAIVTGQVGMDKKRYLEALAAMAGDHGERVDLFHVGEMMYAEASDVRPGRILDLPLARLKTLRRAVFRDIVAEARGASHAPLEPDRSTGRRHAIVNTHATFRWRHGLFAAFDFDQVRQLQPDMLICLVDNVEVTHYRLHRDHTIEATLKDLMVWREEEIMATELLAQALGVHDRFFVMARGRYEPSVETCFRLICRPTAPKVYGSFPMTHVAGMPEVLAEIDAFRRRLAEHFVVFDPGDVDEKLLLESAIDAAKRGEDFIEAETVEATRGGGRETVRFPVSVRQVLDIAGDIDGQIYARDFMLIDQADMIVSLIPELPGGQPGLSSGVERELQHAHEHGREVYVVWKPKRGPSPFVTETATEVFDSVDAALARFDEQGRLMRHSLFGP